MISLERVVRFFRGEEECAADKKAFFNDALFMTLARGTAADANIATLEVDTVCRIYKETSGEDIAAKDVRVAAISDYFKDVSHDKYLSKAADKLSLNERREILKALAAVIKSDEHINPLEVDYFNGVAKALGVDAASL